MSSTIEVRGVSRFYGHVAGVLDVSFEIGPGVTALLGPNGAGKSTLLRLLVGRLRPDRGTVRLYGVDPWVERGVLGRVGYAPEMAPLWPDTSARDLVRDLLRLGGYSAAESDRRADESLRALGLEEAADRKASGYSKGMRQRLRLAQALAHDPDLLLLDEPLTGLDPGGRGWVMGRIRALGREGRTLLVSSHVLHEVEELTDQVLILHQGRLLASGAIYEIRELLGEVLRVTITCDRPRDLFARLSARDDILGLRMEEDGRSLTIETDHADAFHERLLEAIESSGVTVEALHSPDESLEAVFSSLTSRRSGR